MDKQQFFNGAVFDAYRWFGAHLTERNAAVFRTFAPNASPHHADRRDATAGPRPTCIQDGRSGFWEVSVPGTHAQGSSTSTASMPPGRLCHRALRPLRLRHGAAPGVLLDRHRPRDEYRFTDEAWMNSRARPRPDAPLNIYEMHLGSWHAQSGRRERLVHLRCRSRRPP